ncbi:MAG: hypothetical protein K6G85_09130 [Eubacterium sp.]|nr:hypothetical protein [Eubacterium sp.]
MFFIYDEDGEEYHTDYFTKKELDELLAPIRNKTFEALDKRNLFETQKGLTSRQMNKGIFGNVIEQGVLGMKPDPKPKPDITIDYTDSIESYRGILKTEVKTTGVVENRNGIVPKERVSVTGVSIGNIEKEAWEDSRYYHKLRHILWIFYLYEYKDKKNKEKFSPYEQRMFKVLTYGFQHLDEDKKDLDIFKNDWTIRISWTNISEYKVRLGISMQIRIPIRFFICIILMQH